MPYIPTRKTAKRYGVHIRTIERWRRDPALGFPKCVTINHRNYDDTDALDAFDRKCARDRAAGRKPAATAEALQHPEQEV